MTQHTSTDPNRARGIAAAHWLADLLQRGGLPPRLAPPIRVNPNEVCYAQAPAQIMMLIPAGDGSYVHKTTFGFSLFGMAMGAASAVGNQARKAKAARDAMEQWRPVGGGMVLFTTHRLAINQGQSWSNIWFQDLMSAQCDGRSIEIQREQEPAMRLSMQDIDYFFVLLYWLGFQQIIRPPAR
jgi:hypothetical protein